MAEQRFESEFENLRKSLLEQYHSENITHSGFIIALIIGAFSLLASYKDFFDGGCVAILIFYLCISGVIALSCYVIGRLFYWTALSNSVLTLTFSQFNQHKAEAQPKTKDGKISSESERTDIAYMQTFGLKRIKGYNVRTPQIILAKLPFRYLVTLSLIVGIAAYNVLILFSLWYGILHL